MHVRDVWPALGNITKKCHWTGNWQGRTENDFARDHGWTNFTMCYTDEVIYIMNNLNNESLGIAQEVAKNARKLEFVGLGLSLVSLIVSIAIFSYFRRLRVFRNMLHLHLMIAILMVVIIRLVLYIDLIFTGNHGPHQSPSDGKTINTMPFVCEAMYFLLEYFKTVAFGWMFLEGFYLHNQLVLTVFNSEPRLTPYLIAGYGIPGLHTLIWLFVVLVKKDFKVERCLGSYYLEPEFWILDGPRMAELVVNLFFICNVIRVLWSKVRESHSTSELDKMKKSVKAALMLIPLLGIPNIMQTIPFAPTRDNITIFAIWTYLASFTYMYQGLMITIIYCSPIKRYGKYGIENVLRSISAPTYQSARITARITFYSIALSSTKWTSDRSELCDRYIDFCRAVVVVCAVTISMDNNNSSLSPYNQRSKKGSGDSTAKLMLSVPHCGDELVNNNGYGAASERTPLKTQCDCTDEIRTTPMLNGQHVA
ncbi:7 transmembrane receptor [Ancylostoma ceylanicum]|uniref:7 transmembrane receptor n=1 Tax=Ancylostoma ceylanicum TaxID=53326 RepID=A0A0D6M931_9BILA|nr:7 transmembrane receptor [Ancylostoma ceylanicum]